MTAQEVVADYSYAHATEPAKLKKVEGLTGVIPYAGCLNDRKNITKAEFDALIAAGLHVALVIEDDTTSIAHGAGTEQGKRILAAAKALGYEYETCPLIAGYDTDAHGPADYEAILRGMEDFAAEVPFPGYYGDSDSIDYLHARHPNWFYWQSESQSFSPKNPTEHAHIWQQYNDARARRAGLGSSIDINIVRKSPLPFMGENMALTTDDLDRIANHVWDHKRKAGDGSNITMARYLGDARTHAISAAEKADTAAKVLATLPARVASAQKAVADVASAVAAVAGSVEAVHKAVAALAPAKELAVDTAAIASAAAEAVVAKVKSLSLSWKA